MSDHRSLLRIIRRLMMSENLGDVHNEVNLLHDLIGLPRPEGDFNYGWTDKDWAALSSLGDT
jgi:hypothetical protein